jgi:AmmeMemoRadiSam system protein A
MQDDHPSIDAPLGEETRNYLLVTARNAIFETLDLPRSDVDEVSNPVLDSQRGAFVTLKISGRLRGCIGHIEGSQPLRQTIEAMAKAAAFQDPRFPPLAADEAPSISIEISILTPLKQISRPEEIEVGKHGLVVEKGFHRGLLLPQVAEEYKWEQDAFLEHTCRKAGLPADAWQDADTRIFVFSAEVFGEEPASGA